MAKPTTNPNGLKTVHEIALDVLLANMRRGISGKQLAIDSYELADAMVEQGLQREKPDPADGTLPMRKQAT